MLNLQLDRRPLSLVSRLCGTLIILLAAAPIAAIGGQAGATVSGTVTDATGRAIPGVNLTLANPSLDFKVQATTNASGAFEVPVIAGTYQLEARHPGFAMQSQRVTLAAGARVDQSLILQIGSLQETVTVAGGPATDGSSRQTDGTSAPSPRRAQRPIQQCTPSPAGGQIVPPMKILDVRPVYPAGATIGTTRTVPLEARIDVDGTVQDVRATAPVPPELELSAITAVRQWEFTPTLLNCEPVAVTMFVTVTFQPAR